MTAIADHPAAITRPAFITLGLGLIVTVRWAATIAGAADPVAVGLGFGAALAALGATGGWRIRLPRAASIALGMAAAAVLIAIAVIPRLGAVHPSTLSVAFLPWAIATVIVATAEEMVLRGVLFDALSESWGPIAAVLLTSVVFALMHVPLYGWHVVPLDLGVGLILGGLRLLSGGIAAPALAHTIADLATWWL
jgi:membrane protease YdiL (CAAX protease family)